MSATGTVYLLHFERRYRHAQHYLGWTGNLEQRLAQHAAGASHAGRLPQVFRAAGIGFELARTWPGSRSRERQLKAQGGHARKCPICIAVSPARRSRNACCAGEAGGDV